MDDLSRMPEEEVRYHTRYLIETCGHDSGWALETRNSVAPYVPAQNYLTMLEE